ncbi:MAG: antitoxin [Acidimicrobiales bacterium]
MRTTLTLEDDVTALLQRVRRHRQSTFKQLVNEALRQGLAGMEVQASPVAFSTRSVSVGRSMVGPLDSIADVIALAEGEAIP